MTQYGTLKIYFHISVPSLREHEVGSMAKRTLLTKHYITEEDASDMVALFKQENRHVFTDHQIYAYWQAEPVRLK